jgi:DNA-binding CsgD family transcriptional regulator
MLEGCSAVVKKKRKGFRKGSAHGSVCQGELPPLTSTEQEIYVLWAKDHQTPVQIALRRGCSDRAVRKHIANIKRKGYVLNMVPGVPNSETTTEPSRAAGSKIRLHGQHFVVRLLSKRPAYDQLRRRSNVQYVLDITVKLHRESIEVFASPGLSFFGASADKATAKSMEFWTRTLHRLESHLGVVLLKPRAQNVRQVSAHYARINCGMAQEALDAGDRVQLFAREDGKLWFTIDNSFNLAESETLHPETAQRDMADVVEPHLNDWREHGRDLWVQSDLQRALQDVMRQQAMVVQSIAATAESLQVLARYLESQVPREPAQEMPEGWRPPYVG